MNDVGTSTDQAIAMDPPTLEGLQRQVDEINRKLDVILEEVDLQRRHRREMEDLRDDAMRVGKDVYQTAIVELEEMHENVDTADIAHLLKRILRNIDSINATLESLESTRDFLQDFSPISRAVAIIHSIVISSPFPEPDNHNPQGRG